MSNLRQKWEWRKPFNETRRGWTDESCLFLAGLSENVREKRAKNDLKFWWSLHDRFKKWVSLFWVL